ncbi:MAG: condensation domain-containing protein, partial [Pseudonocardiaceae bacterium]
MARLIEQTRRIEQGLAVPPLRAVGRGGELVLSFAQQRLWFLDQLMPGNVAYNLPVAFRLRGALDVAVLSRALDEIVARHEVLRTTFPTVGGQPVQVVAPPSVGARLAVTDLRGVDPAEREATTARLAAAEATQAFDLASGPLLRVGLVRLGDDEQVLLLTLHHIITDGWSQGVFFTELGALYDAFLRGETSPLSPLTVQYADFAHWQRSWLRGEVLDTQLAYWRVQLAGAPAVLELPSDFPHPAELVTAGGQVSVRLGPELLARLEQLARRERVTLFMTLLAAFQVVLGRYSASTDVVVGSPIAGRTRTEIEALIGFFVNTLVLRTDLSGDPPFIELLARVRQVTLEAYTHQDLPFEQLVDALNPTRDLSGTPLVQVLFNYFTDPSTRPEVAHLPGMTVKWLGSVEPTPKFPLTLYAREGDGELSLRLVYQRALFTPTRMSGVLAQLIYLLEQIVEDPDRCVNHYSLVEASAAQVLPDPTVPLVARRHALVRDMINFWVRASPRAIAIEQGERTCSYAELQARADRIRSALAAGGLGSGDVVAILGPPSLGLITAMVAVLSSPGVMLTLDHRLPDHRLQAMLTQAHAAFLVLVTDDPDAQVSPTVWVDGLPVLRIDPATAAVTDLGPGEVAPARIGPDNPAYVFFTSGTTGVPQGVLGQHNALSHFLAWQRDTFKITAHDRCAQLTGLSFDPVLRDVFLPLVSGATLCLPPTEDQSPEQTITWLAQTQITCVHTVPTLARAWLHNRADTAIPTALRYTFFAGEPLTGELVRAWRQTCPATQVINLYGTT